MTTVRSAIVVPCYNEAPRLRVADYRRFLDTSTTEIVFVDDGSTDATPGVLRTLSQHSDRVQVLTLRKNSGKAEAVRRGISHALKGGFDFVGFWDADLSTPLDCISRFEQALVGTPSLEMVMGARVKLLGRQIERRAARHYLGRIFAAAASATLRLPIYDSQCGAKLFRNSEMLHEVFERPFLSRWAFDVEILARYIVKLGGASVLERRVYEFPLLEWHHVDGSKVRARDFVTALWDLVRITRAYRLGTRAPGAAQASAQVGRP